MEKTENLALQHKEQSTGLIAILTNQDTARQLEKGLTIEKIVDKGIPICEVARFAGTRQVAIAIDIQLTRLVANLNLKWSLNDAQIKTIVEDLIEKYPNETIEDFILVFKKARLGEFGELIRLDSPIIFTWMEKYLEEKYQVVEDKLMKEKDEFFRKVVPENSERDYLQEWLDSIKDAPEGIKRVRQLTDEEIKSEGQEQPKRGTGFKYDESEAEIRLREHHEQLWKFQEMSVRERHPEYTEEEIKAKCDELKNTVLTNNASVRFSNKNIEKLWLRLTKETWLKQQGL
jgi:hypothetical protein